MCEIRLSKNTLFNPNVVSILEADLRIYPTEKAERTIQGLCNTIFRNMKYKDISKLDIDEKYKFDKNNRNNKKLSFMLTKEETEIYKTIETDGSFTNYCRQLFGSYCSMSEYERKTILFKEVFYKINLVIERKQEVEITNLKKEKYTFRPYILKNNYLIGMNKNNEVRNPNVFAIESVTTTSKKTEFTAEEIFLCKKKYEDFSPFSIKEVIFEVKFDSKGLDLLYRCKNYRPKLVGIKLAKKNETGYIQADADFTEDGIKSMFIADDYKYFWYGSDYDFENSIFEFKANFTEAKLYFLNILPHFTILGKNILKEEIIKNLEDELENLTNTSWDKCPRKCKSKKIWRRPHLGKSSCKSEYGLFSRRHMVD